MCYGKLGETTRVRRSAACTSLSASPAGCAARVSSAPPSPEPDVDAGLGLVHEMRPVDQERQEVLELTSP